MGNSQGWVILGIMALMRYRINDWPVKFLENQPNKRYALALMGLWALYNMLKHKGMLPKKNVDGKHVFITGGGMGIGRLMAHKFAQLNCKVTIADIGIENAEKVVQEIKSFNENVQAFKCDVTSVSEIKSVVKDCMIKFGEVDILINNAGIVTGKKLLDNTEKGIDMTFQVNAISHAHLVREILPSMIQRNSGHIVSIASIAGHLGVAGLCDYSASKFAAIGFDESLRMELKSIGSKIKTTCICPYYINTGMFDGITPSWLMNLLLPILDPNYASQRIVDAVRQEESMVLIPGFLYLITFLKSVMPVWMYDVLQDVTGTNKSMSDKFKGREQKF